MKYPDWKNSFVKSASPPATNGQSPVQSGTINTGTLEKNGLGQMHTEEMTKILENAPPEIQATWNKYADRMVLADANYKGGARYTSQGVKMDMASVARGDKDFQTGNLNKKPYYTAFHEFGHNISDLMVKDLKGYNWLDISDLYQSKTFMNPNGAGFTLTDMLKKEGNDYINNIWTRLKNEAKAAGLSARTVDKAAAYRELTREILAKPVINCSDISDIFDGVTKGVVRPHYGHGASYWKNHTVGTEAFAEMFSATAMNPGSVSEIQHYFPDSYKIFEEIIQALGVN